MNSKERVRNAIARKPVDKVPLGFYLVDCDTIARVIGRSTYLRNNPAYTAAIWEGRRDEVVASMKQDLTDLYRKLDCVDLLTFKEAQVVPPKGYRPEDPPRKIADNLYEDSKGNAYQLVPENNDIRMVKSAPSAEPAEYTEAMFTDRTLPAIPDPTCFELLDHLVREFGRDRYIAGYCGGITAMTLLGGMEEGLMRLATQPEVIKACNEQKVFQQNLLDQYYIRPGVDGVHMEQDFGGTQGPLISPAMFRDLCFPYLKRRIAHVKEFVPQIPFHCCGSILPLLPMLIEAGIDAYESIQTNAVGMSLDNVARLYGDRLCLWGAISLDILIRGTPADVRREVRQCLEVGRHIPGFILGPSHSIAFGTKYENFMAMLDEFEKLRDRDALL